LVGVFSPQDLELRMQSDIGDVDIIIHTEPPHLLQVKDLVSNTIRPTEDDKPLELEKAISTVLKRVKEDIEESGWKGGTFTKVRIHLNNDKVLAMSGDCMTVEECNENINVSIIDVDSSVFELSMKLKLERCIRKAYSQLRYYQNNEIIVPVLNMSRYPHNQSVAYKAMKELFKDNPGWMEIGGILMVTNDYFRNSDSTGFHRSRIRLIGIENPNADSGRRLKLSLFNPNLDDEEIYEEDRMSILIEPYGTPYMIKGNSIYINRIKFGSISPNLSYPKAVRLRSNEMPIN